MTDADRDALRALQDRWLAHPLVRAQTTRHGEEHGIAGPGSPTFREVRTTILPAWRGWFTEWLEEAGR